MISDSSLKSLLPLRRTLFRYLIREMLPTFLSTLLIFVLIMVAARMLSITEWVVDRGVHPVHVIKLVYYLLPNVMLIALPAASLMAVLVAFLRMSSDNEIIAFNSCGISLYQMLPPVITLSVASCLLACFIALFAAPWGNRAFKDTVFRIVETRADVNLKERVFYEPFDNVIFYVNSFSSKQGIMKDVFVVDRRDETSTNSIVAKEGRILFHPEAKIVTIFFREGTIFMVEKDLGSARSMKFKTYELSLSLQDILPSADSRKKSPREMYLGELIHQIRERPQKDTRYNEMVIRLLESFTIPVAVFFMALIGAPLGAQIRSRGRSLGIFLGLVIFLFYYMFMMGARSICEAGTVSPFLGMWIPILFLMICCGLLLKIAGAGEAAKVDRWVRERVGFRKRAGQRDFHVKEMIPSQAAPKESIPVEKGVEDFGVSSTVASGEEPFEIEKSVVKFVGNKSVNKFHRPDSHCSKRIAPQNRVEFQSREEALNEGFVSCKVCKP